MTARRSTKAVGGYLWRWLDTAEELSRTDESLTTAQRSTVRHVATKKARSADPDGRNCYPSQATLARYAGVTRDSVRWAEGWLTRNGLQVLTKHAGRGTSTRYRLTLPVLDDRGDGHPTDGKMTVGTVIQDKEDDRQDDRQDDRGDGHNRLPPSKDEEEESASALDEWTCGSVLR
jgi:hypothetical protein